MYRFRSRTALWVVRVFVSIFLIGCLAYLVYSIGDCDYGQKRPAECGAIPDSVGSAMFSVGFMAFAFSYWIGSWIVSIAVLWELALWFLEKE